MTAANAFAGVVNLFVVPRFFPRSEKSGAVFSYLAGLEFGVGLFITGMADPVKVLRFFLLFTDLSRFDPSLALVILFGVGPSFSLYLLEEPGKVPKDGKTPSKPTLTERWRLPTASVADIDWRFVAGSIVFGLSWGFSGSCPGPAILRSVFQPAWGLVTMSGYVLGNLF